jgi:peroxiredoxin
MTLQQELDTFFAKSAKEIPPQLLADLQTSIDDVSRSGIAARALGAGAVAPEFTLPNALGKPVSLADLLRRGPLIISFYRGIWCPYCSLELRAYRRILGDIRAVGGDFIAISPQTPDNSLSTAQKNALEFEVLSDDGNQVASAFGIAYPTPEIVKRITASFGADIAAINGGSGDQLPIAATYVVARDGQIRLAEANPDFRIRLEPAVALAAIRELAGVPEQPESEALEQRSYAPIIPENDITAAKPGSLE